MALKLKYTDEHGILHINMSPSSSPGLEGGPGTDPGGQCGSRPDLTDPQFDTINNRFAQYDLFGGKYDMEANELSGGDEPRASLFRSRYNSIEEELANTPYAFTTDRSLRDNNPIFDITIKTRAGDTSPSKDIEDDRFFNKNYASDLFGPQLELQTASEEAPAFTVTQLIHAQDRYFDLSSRHSSNLNSPRSSDKVSLESRFEVRSAPGSAKKERTVTIVDRVSSVSSGGSQGVKGGAQGAKGPKDGSFRVLAAEVNTEQQVEATAPSLPITPKSKRKHESSFAILPEPASRPSSPRSLPAETRSGRSSPFRGRGFRDETSRHNTPRTSTNNSRATSPLPRRSGSLPRIDKMAATLPPLVHRPHSPRNFLKENIEEVRELSELNREKHELEAEEQRREEEEALLREMGLMNGSRSNLGSRTASRSNSPSKINLRSRSSSPSAILRVENIPANSREVVNAEDGMAKPVLHNSRLRSVSRSQPQSNNGSPKHSKIPKRQNSVSPSRSVNRWEAPKRGMDSNLNKNQRFISNSTSSIHETIKLGSSVHDKRPMSKSTQHLSIAPSHIRGKPPISPGKQGPPPSNKTINPKRLSPIVGTPNKSPTEDPKPGSARTPTKPSSMARKSVKTAGNTPASSRFTSKQPSRSASRDPSPEKRRVTLKAPTPKAGAKPASNAVNRTQSSRTTQKPNVPIKSEVKKAIPRTNSMKSLVRTPSTKNLNEKPPVLKKRDSKKDLMDKVKSTSKINEVGAGKEILEAKNDTKTLKKETEGPKKESKVNSAKVTKKTSSMDAETQEEVSQNTQDTQTQHDSITNEKGDLIILTKKNIVSMTTAAITAQPLEIVTTVTNQLPAALEKAREKGIFERHSSKDSIAAPKDLAKEDDSAKEKVDTKEAPKDKPTEEKKEAKSKDIKEVKDTPKEPAAPKPIFHDDSIKLKPLQPPYNNPQIARAKQKIDDILKSPEVSAENILVAAVVEPKEPKQMFKKIADKAKTEIKESKDDVAAKLTEMKDQMVKQNTKAAEDIRKEATKIVDSIITPVEQPKEIKEPPKVQPKSTIEPIVMVVNEKKTNGPQKAEVVKTTAALVKGEADVEVQSSNVSPAVGKMLNKMADGTSDKSGHSNGGLPQSTSTTPKPPARARRGSRSTSQEAPRSMSQEEQGAGAPRSERRAEPSQDPENPPAKKQNICQRLIGKYVSKTKCCACCVKPELDEDEVQKRAEDVEKTPAETRQGLMSKLNCCRKKEREAEAQMAKDIERAAGKVSLDFEDEAPKRRWRDVLCGCCGRRRRVSDASVDASLEPDAVAVGCCGRRRVVERRDSILSDRPPSNCCVRMSEWVRGACRRRGEPPASRRPSLFSKNKSLSPTLPPEVKDSPVYKLTHKACKSQYLKGESKMALGGSQPVTPAPSPAPARKRQFISTDLMKADTDIEDDIEDTRPKLDPSLIEHTSAMRGAIPILPIALAYICLVCNILVPGLGTIFSGMFNLCFGIPRFGAHDGAKYRIGAFVMNLFVGAGQLFTVLFCLVGWGWSIWWGVIMLRVSRKYRKLRAEARAAEAAEAAAAAPPVTANNHTRA